MTELWLHNDGEQSSERVQRGHPLPVELLDPVQIASIRKNGVHLRSNVTVVDKLAGINTAVTVMTAASTATTGGGLSQSTNYYIAYAAANDFGPTVASAILTTATGAGAPTTHVAGGTLAAISGAKYYDIFFSTSATAPLFVGRITEAQRAAGCIITTASTGSAAAVVGAGNGAGIVECGVVGTSALTCLTNPWAYSNAYTIPPNMSCLGFTVAHCLAQISCTDFYTLPTASIIPIYQNQGSPSLWHTGTKQDIALLTGKGQAQLRIFDLDVRSVSGVSIALDTVSGNGTALDAWVELS